MTLDLRVFIMKKFLTNNFFSNFFNRLKKDNSSSTIKKASTNKGADKIKVTSVEELKFYITNEIDKEGIFCDLNFLDVSSIDDMSFLFASSPFRGDISKWDVSNVRDMSYMFAKSDFDGDLSQWNVSNVVYMNSMFKESHFNQDLSNWNIQSAVDLHGMFFKSVFNNKLFRLGKAVRDMSYMFAYTKYSHYIGDWDVSGVTDMTGMFMNSNFNGDLSQWKVENVEYFDNMFSDSCFKGDVSNWKPIKAKSMSFMFNNKTNKEMIKNWDLTKVDQTGMFHSKYLFEDHEKIAEKIFKSLPVFESACPNDFLRFGVPVTMNGKFYIIKVCNSPFDSENWYVNTEEVSKEQYELQKKINELFGKK